ncbi:hypothetical protein [Pedobacter hartonius]|uniref:Uncharacterized protein n=1 Tax=Pedobacter hartonius TaxID=425514 RepID=A0A1H4D0J8_9SPHI|nr:hypothetical protein [Pedobacter hartonius]SEA66128.1 hypothetical protein SAMN05443550_104274 [Pedobacter hartonius]
MKNEKEEQKHKAPDNEQYDIANPQNLTQPQFNSTTAHREGPGLPAVENLNQIKGLKTDLKDAREDDSDPSAPNNDESLYGKNTKTDLGAGQRDEGEGEAEKIIRTGSSSPKNKLS